MFLNGHRGRKDLAVGFESDGSKVREASQWRDPQIPKKHLDHKKVDGDIHEVIQAV